MKKIGLTGGIGSGKSYIAKAFTQLGVPVFDSDEVAKSLLAQDSSLKKELVNLLGAESYVDGALQRDWVASKIFSNPELRNQLALLVHPKVYEAFDQWVKTQSAPYVIFESALLLEGGNAALFDSIWVVEAPMKLRLSRLHDRGLSKEKAIERINSQWTDAQRRKFADMVWNNDEVSDIMLKIYDIHTKLTS